MAKKKESPKILLINFDKKIAENVQKVTGVEVVRGYISGGDDYTENHNGVSVPQYYYNLPTPPYECAMVFVNLDNYEATAEEFKAGTKVWSATEYDNMRRYWHFNSKLLVFFAGDTRVGDMTVLGVPLKLIESSGTDKQTRVRIGENTHHHQLVEEIDAQLVMPNAKYLELTLEGETDYYRSGTRVYSLVGNANGDRLAVAMTKARDDYDMDEPGLMVFPAVRQPNTVISKMVRHFASHYELELSESAWLESDVFYPVKGLNKLNGEIEDLVSKARIEVDKRQQQISGIKEEYSYLKDLLTEEGDVLVDAVYKVLTELLGMTVTKSDEANQSNQKEDLLIELGDNKILIEVKGTKRQNPSLSFPQQAMQHAIRQGLAGLTSTGLILNHDRETDPKSRILPYNTDDSKELITDIHFIDVRVLHEMAIDVADGKLKPKNAVAMLFDNLGRAEYAKG